MKILENDRVSVPRMVGLIALLVAAVLASGQAPAVQAPAPVPAPPRGTNTNSLELVRAFAQTRGIKLDLQGESPVRIAVVGAAAPGDIKEMLRLAAQTVKTLELWTGGNEVFSRKGQPEAEDYILCVLPDDDFYKGFVGWLRDQGRIPPPTQGRDDLILQLGGFPMRRLLVTKADLVQRSSRQWSVYATACMAIDSYYLDRGGKRTPTWIREGLAAELQRSQTGAILWTTIAYELNNEKAVLDWPFYVADLIKKNDQMLATASSLMERSLDAMPGAVYRQIWSLATFVRLNCDGAGKKNKLLRLLEATAQGTPSATAVHDIFKVKDPNLTQAWRQWAMDNKAMK